MQRDDFVRQLETPYTKARASLEYTQERYKCNMDSRFRLSRRFEILPMKTNTVALHRGEVVETISRAQITIAAPQPSPELTGTPGARPHHFREKRSTGRTWLINRILTHLKKPDGE